MRFTDKIVYPRYRLGSARAPGPAFAYGPYVARPGGRWRVFPPSVGGCPFAHFRAS